ncbi:MAG: IS200/IS605 family transposase [Candidatus Micrarchaeales archaeon]
MNSITQTRNIEVSAKALGHPYNYQHLVFVTKYRNKIFTYQEVIDAIRRGILEICEKFGLQILEFSFGDTYDHIHLEVNVPNKYAISKMVQALKSHSASVAFRDAPITKTWFLHGSFWNGGYGNSSVGFATQDVVGKYIRRQDISKGQRKIAV